MHKKARKRTTKRRYARARRTSVKKKLSRLNKRVSKVSRLLNAVTCVKNYRERVTTPLNIAAINEGVFAQNSFGAVNAIERAITKLEFFDPSSPSVPIEANGNSGLYQRAFAFSSKYYFTAKNSYMVPVYCTLWLCLPRMQTSLGPADTWERGLDDLSISTTDILIKPQDSAIFKNTWRVIKTKRALLPAGARMTMSYSARFTYDPTVQDVFGKIFYPQYDGSCILIRIEGDIAHLSTNQNFIGTGLGAIDMVKDIYHTVTYDGGFNANLVEVFNGGDVMATPVTGVKPFTDNLAFNAA